MSKKKKQAFWFLGLLLLIFLLQYPTKQAINSSNSTWSMPLNGKVIVIDPGHGGPDGGAVGSDGTVEKDIALSVAKIVQSYLMQHGAIVHLTREEDVDLAAEGTSGLANRKSEDIRNRLAFIQEKEAEFFISIHLNALPDSQWHGAQTFYYPRFEEGEHLATMIQEEIIRNLENTDRQPLAIDQMYLLKHAEVPGALVEIGFLSNEVERELLKDDTYQRQMAASIYEGILRYVTEEPQAEESE
ncbi:germination-specific N-acetylmuramoyl-L-alanine amidase [Oceanobacillus oncorhynchi subsp. incaldanensis]|uniref:Germination-specific N-acetylmuramoyl-L-alanine amidase n=2 Tax=Oceanobacillus TaxID=182709 RepID=A0A0A1MRP5_9BACI|nr:N-acetylmuramoyl-L-alanine amidase CwlD [Oceanobacillus oncorhynchi]MDM8102169.1 N-acetylmuramoyl-L-alanine amidase CwlD [Oceanobacillus oncorhynchi]UUI40271.1 N-acetylmuramoyl-L-alanine amidase CwlD [Oceanobacillus oncorhynchi]GIO21345.1 germination-specific N-acetylmuramoyl-L-alanine amidase [Oceanobacillus oncorhynchi subsp. incaldanensis]CEI81691.1 Germination-specific N-acetylmuramoyl-L-alanine amidase precursor [Oceanobacillus oncorhynchi]